jgi:hypothetical protein
MSYRDDHDALSSYHDNLTQALTDLEAKAAALAQVVSERDRVARELVRVRADLEQSRARRAAPIRLDELRVAAPCNVPWDAMKGDDRARDCAKCEKTVYNISSMTRAEAEDFLAARGATACVRFFRRTDGTIMTSDCPVGVKRRRRKLAIAAGALAGVAGAAGVAATMVSTTTQGKVVVEQGGVALPRDPYIELKGQVVLTPADQDEAQGTRKRSPQVDPY